MRKKIYFAVQILLNTVGSLVSLRIGHFHSAVMCVRLSEH